MPFSVQKQPVEFPKNYIGPNISLIQIVVDESYKSFRCYYNKFERKKKRKKMSGSAIFSGGRWALILYLCSQSYCKTFIFVGYLTLTVHRYAVQDSANIQCALLNMKSQNLNL